MQPNNKLEEAFGSLKRKEVKTACVSQHVPLQGKAEVIMEYSLFVDKSHMWVIHEGVE